MRFEIKINKLASQYLFISELSQWNDLYCIPERKKEWVKKTGKISLEETQELKKFSKILRNAPEGTEWLFIFEEKDKVWYEIEKRLNKSDFRILKQIFVLFNKKFNLIWEEEEKKLEKISKHINKNKKQIDKNLLIIKKLTGVKKNNFLIKIHLLMDSSKKEAQAWSNKNNIILECSNCLAKKKLPYLINCILMHELFHFIIKKNKKLFNNILSSSKKIKSYLPKNLTGWDAKIIFEDALISSFLPEGYLAEKFCKINSKKENKKELHTKKNNNFTRLRNFCALENYEIAKKYVKKEKIIDKNYLNKIIDCIKKQN